MVVLIPFLEHYSAEGGDIEDLAVYCGLDPDIVNDPMALAPSNTMHKVANVICRRLKDPFVGARIGRQWVNDNSGPFQEIRLASSTLLEVLYGILANFSSESTAANYELVLSGGEARFRGSRTYTPRYSEAQADATFISFIVSLIRLWVGRAWNAKYLSVTTGSVKSIPDWILPPSSLTRGPKNELSIGFPPDWLSIAKKSLDYENNLDELSNYRFGQIGKTYVQVVEDFLNKHLDDSNLNLAQAAAVCGISERALQRIFDDYGKSFTAFLSELKKARSIELLENSEMKIASIARSLGYLNTSNYCRAFRNWTGRSPSQYRIETKTESQSN
jgi:AraC-like DNA-binding protein